MNANKRTGRTIFQCVLLAALFTALLVLFYLTIHGFPESTVRALERKIQINGLAIRLGAVKLNAFDGLIIQNVRCYRKRDIGCPFFEAEKVAIRLNPARRIRGESDWKEARVRNGVFRIVVDNNQESSDPDTLRLDNVNVVLTLNRHARVIRAEDLSADFLNVKIRGRGVIPLPEKTIPKPDEPRIVPKTDEIERVVCGRGLGELARNVAKLSSKHAITADIEFLLDPLNVRNLEAKIRVASREKAGAKDSPRTGAFSAHADIRAGAGKGSASMNDQVLMGVPVKQARASFEFDDQTFSLLQLHSEIGGASQRGPLKIESASYRWGTGEFEGNVFSAFDPRALLEPLDATGSHAANVIRDFYFASDPIACEAAFKGVVGRDWRLTMSGTARAEDCFYKGVSNAVVETGFSTDLTETSRIMTLAPLKVKSGDESSEVNLRLDFLAETVEFEGVSTADPLKTARMIGPFMARTLEIFSFQGPANIIASGIAGFNDQALNDIDIHVEARDIGWERFLFDDVSMDIKVQGDVVRLNGIKGTACGGEFEADVLIVATEGRTNAPYKVDARINGADFDLIMRAVTGEEKTAYRGRCSASVSLEGYAGEGQGKTVSGQGSLEIRDGHIFQIPLFGELSSMMAKLVPGLSLILRQTCASAAVIIEDGRICSDKILIEGDVFSIRGRGCYSLSSELSFDSRVVLFRQQTLVGEVMRIVTLPVSKIFEFRLRGTLANPRWRPVYLPKEMFLIFGQDDDDR